MSTPWPKLDRRRSSDFERELLERARAWIPAWGLDDGQDDFGRALLKIAARFSAEVAERLDRAGDKMARGFLDWLAFGGRAAQPARLPIVFKLADTAPAVDTTAPVKLQVSVGEAPIVLESETDVRLIPGHLELAVGVDVTRDAYYLPPPGLSSLDPLLPLPTKWQVKSFAGPSAEKLQLDPALGLTPGSVLEIQGQQFRVVEAKGDLVTIDPPVPVAGGFDPGTSARKVESFVPFDSTARNWQRHIVYIGDPDLLNIDASAYVDVVGGETLGSDAVWEYWGKNPSQGDPDKIAWWPLPPDPAGPQIDAMALQKPEGSVEMLKIGDLQSRWLRARVGYVNGCAPASTIDELSLRINAPATNRIVADAGNPKLEVFVNSTPSAPSNFFPLGQKPRLFDTLYLGCAEAFAKAKATVDVDFELADTSFWAVAVLHAGPTDGVLAGVDKAGALHLLQINPNGSLSPPPGRGPMQPPRGGGAAPKSGNVAPQGKFRPLMWSVGADYFVALAVGPDVWVWHENGAAPTSSSFDALGPPLPAASSSADVQGMALVDSGGAPAIVALCGKRLFMWVMQSGAQWTALPADDPVGTPLDVESIASIRSNVPGGLIGALIAIDANGGLYYVDVTQATKLLSGIASDVGPCAFQNAAGDLQVIAAAVDHKTLTATELPALSFSPPPAQKLAQVPLEVGDTIADTLLDVRLEGGGPTAYGIAIGGDGHPCVLAWTPFNAGLANLVFKTQMDPAAGVPTGALTLHDGRAFMPGALGAVLAASFAGARGSFSADANRFTAAMATSPVTPAYVTGDTVALVKSVATDSYQSAAIVAGPTLAAGEHYYWLAAGIDLDTATGDYHVLRASNAMTQGARTQSRQYQLDPLDTITTDGSLLLIDVGAAAPEFYSVHDVVTIAGVRYANLEASGHDPPNMLTTGNYRPSERIRARIPPALQLDSTNNSWEASVLSRGDLYFPALQPARQHATATMLDAAPPGTHPLRIALATQWTVSPAGTVNFVVDATSVVWASLIGDTTSNPALSWEYWDGSGWTQLPLQVDPTQNLKHSGVITFVAPSDLKPTEWAGKKNHWIRARLIGGDYGKEKVVVTSTTSGNTTTQVVDQTSDSIQAPWAIKVSVKYHLDVAALPAYLITEDSGTTRDQSDANRTDGAQIELFTPLCATLAKLNGPAEAGATEASCSPDCECGSTPTSASVATVSAPAVAESPIATPASAGRALYLGFSAPFSGEPINVLIVVDQEHPYDTLAPLEVETLAGGRFEPVIAQDGTRAAGETGILSLAVPVAPSPAELFGRSLAWLRLTPGAGDGTLAWAPAVRGVYVNAVWARTAETMTRELVGSSEGAPDLVLQLGRPPLLHDTLELRVREPLGEEERANLVKSDPTRVLSAVTNLPGDWVRWDCVIDPADRGPADRAYSLDEQTGTLRFGDGLHGMIPPTGRDAIVAFSYQRTEPPPVVEPSAAAAAGGSSRLAPGSFTLVPANTIAPRTSINLISPVQGVEAAFAADQAAGGAAPEADERVLAFAPARLRQRGRAVTLRDFEDLALQSSSDIVQARAFARPAGVRLVVVMRGTIPQPTNAARRELRRALLGAAPGRLAAPSALQIEGPIIRRLRVTLLLQVISLDVSGAIATYATRALQAFFDSAAGGLDRYGWPLGSTPSEDDIALALLEAPGLESIERITFSEIDREGEGSTWRGGVRPNEIVMLADEGVRVDFRIVETVQ